MLVSGSGARTHRVDRASRIRLLAIRLSSNGGSLRGFADLLERGDTPDRFACSHLAELVAAITHDAGALEALTQDFIAPATESEQSDALIAEVEGEREPDPPGRVTPGERPSTRAGTLAK